MPPKKRKAAAAAATKMAAQQPAKKSQNRRYFYHRYRFESQHTCFRQASQDLQAMMHPNTTSPERRQAMQLRRRVPRLRPLLKTRAVQHQSVEVGLQRNHWSSKRPRQRFRRREFSRKEQLVLRQAHQSDEDDLPSPRQSTKLPE